MALLDNAGLSHLWSTIKTYVNNAISGMSVAWGNISDKPSWIGTTKPSYTSTEVGAISTASKGVADGVASLDTNGKVPVSQIPSDIEDSLTIITNEEIDSICA